MKRDDPLAAAKFELRCAASAIVSMRDARSYEAFEHSWRVYLQSIEKCWTKVAQGYRHISNRFQPWQSSFARTRNEDMLLRYLMQARNADAHSIQQITEYTPSQTQLRLTPAESGGRVHVRNLVIRGGKISYDNMAPSRTEINTVPPRIVLRDIVNRGVEYNVPTEHRGTALPECDPISVAEKGLAFYEDFLNRAEKEFGAT